MLYVLVNIGVIEYDTKTSRFVDVVGCMSGPMFEYDILVVHSGFSANANHVELAGSSLNSLYDPLKMVYPFPSSKMTGVQFMY